jgi:hypothetical protein
VMDDKIRRVRPLVLRFSPGRGVLVDAFPSEIVVTSEVLSCSRQHAGVFWVHGNGAVGTTITVTAANGEAVYEITGRCELADGKQTPAWVATRRSWKLRIAGKPVEVRVYGLEGLRALFGAWPLAAAIRKDVLEPPQSWWSHVAWLKDVVTFSADGETAKYRVFGRHPGEPDTYLVQRFQLQTATKSVVTLPEAHLASTTKM